MSLPVGYYRFHKNTFINYRLNRWHALGYALKEDLENLAAGIKSFEDYVARFKEASEQAQQEGRLKNAAAYLRAAEFLISPQDPDKIPFYKQYIALFDRAFEYQGFERHKIPYREGHLSAIRIPSKTGTSKGTLVAIPGFDALVEEFYCIWDYFAQKGYDCIAFEGPGQGGSLRLYGHTFDHDYEKPTAAVLDCFGISKAAALGVSMGGYWIMRAAAFEKRIERVIAMPPVYDWLEMTGSINRALARWFLTKPTLANFFIKLKMRIGTLRHTINHALFLLNETQPHRAMAWLMGMNKTHLHSHLIDQDVLLLGGENDAFQPPILLQKQKQALTSAKSVTERIFTKAEQADQHCQIGNLEIALDSMVRWLDGFSFE